MPILLTPYFTKLIEAYTKLFYSIFLLKIYIAPIVLIVCLCAKKRKTNEDSTTANTTQISYSNAETVSLLRKTDELTKNSPNYNYSYSYTAHPLLTYNEQYAFKSLLNWADKNNLLISAKVRVLDLVSPIRALNNYQALLYKIQAKHVDFVICNRNMKVLFIIELNDKSHLRPDRIERDKFIKEILESTGYILIQTYAITEDILNDALNKALNKQQ